jgi:hypothetical protein
VYFSRKGAENFTWSGPKDRVLGRLGGELPDIIKNNDFLRAYELLDLIEAREMHLRAKVA